MARSRFSIDNVDGSIRKGLKDAVDNEPWNSLRILADLAEEQGEERTARVIRWIIKYRRIPNAKCVFFSERLGGGADTEYYWYPKKYDTTEYINIEQLVSGNSSHAIPTFTGYDGRLRKRFDSPWEAYLALVDYLRSIYWSLRRHTPEWVREDEDRQQQRGEVPQIFDEVQ